MPKHSAGLLLYRGSGHGLEVLLVHLGGPYWAKRDDGAWTVPKGEYEQGDDPKAAAQREFAEELGSAPPAGRLLDLGEVRQSGGKWTRLWALYGDLDVTVVHSNSFEMEWPPHSGRRSSFPEVDRAAWFTLPEARTKLLSSLTPFLGRLVAQLGTKR